MNYFYSLSLANKATQIHRTIRNMTSRHFQGKSMITTGTIFMILLPFILESISRSHQEFSDIQFDKMEPTRFIPHLNPGTPSHFLNLMNYSKVYNYFYLPGILINYLSEPGT